METNQTQEMVIANSEDKKVKTKSLVHLIGNLVLSAMMFVFAGLYYAGVFNESNSSSSSRYRADYSYSLNYSTSSMTPQPYTYYQIDYRSYSFVINFNSTYDAHIYLSKQATVSTSASGVVTYSVGRTTIGGNVYYEYLASASSRKSFTVSVTLGNKSGTVYLYSYTS